MKTAIASIKMIAPYCQSRYHGTPKKAKELADDYERRTWKERAHYDEDGEIFIPALAFANAIKEVAKYLSIKVPGKARATYTKHFDAGVAVVEDIKTGKFLDDAVEKRMFVPSDGRRGGGSRVMKSYPILLPPFSITAEFQIMDDVITAPIFAQHLQQAGSLIGVGSFRIRNGGVYGRFKVENIDWIEYGEGEETLPSINYVLERAAA